MRKIFIISLLIFLVSYTKAQTFITSENGLFDNGIRYDYPAISIPIQFTYDNEPFIIVSSENDYEYNGCDTIHILNADLEEVKKVEIKNAFNFNYEVTYKDYKRKVAGANVVKTEIYGGRVYSSYEEFVDYQMMLDPNLTPDDFSIVTNSEGKQQIMFSPTTVRYPEQYYYAYTHLGTKYPMYVFIIEENGKVYQYTNIYEPTFTEWAETGQRTEKYTKEMDCMSMSYIDLNKQHNINGKFSLTQTLFNNDSDFEYIIPKCTIGKNDDSPSGVVNPGTEDIYGQNLNTTRTETMTPSDVLMSGFQVVSETGEVISDIDFDTSFAYDSYNYGYSGYNGVVVISIGDNVYLALSFYNNGKDKTLFYKIDKETSAISHVKSGAFTMLLQPAVVNKNATINVNFTDDNTNGSDVSVFNSNGTEVDRINISAGNTSGSMHMNVPSGVYVATRKQNGKIIESKKFIVK